jgi:hypothetical protein
MAVSQGQINCYAENPRINAASALEIAYLLYYFDKRLLRKFRGVVGIRTNPQYRVVNTAVILSYQTPHRRRIAASAPLHKEAILSKMSRPRLHSFSPYLDQLLPSKVPKITANTPV